MNTETIETDVALPPGHERAAETPKPQKWQTEVGPRLTKQVEEALKEINWQHGFYKEKTGIIGVDEKEWSYNIIFGGRREDVASAWRALGDKYGWTITKPTMAAIIAEAKALVETLRASAPVVDKRVTIEQDTARKAEQAKAEEERAAVDAEKARAREAGTAKWRAQYPWAIQSGSSQARGAANIKRLLAEAFPGIAFSVKSSRFSGGDSITVSWEMGPTTDAPAPRHSHRISCTRPSSGLPALSCRPNRRPPHRQTRSTWPSKIGWPNRLASVASSSRIDCSPTAFD